MSHESSESSESREKEVKLQCRYFLLTYKSHIDKKAMSVFISDMYLSSQVTIAHEIGESGYEHTHVVVDIGSRTCIRKLSKFNFGEIHPNLKLLKSIQAYRDALKYISKEDKEVDVPVVATLAADVWACSTLQEALSKYVYKPSDATGIMALYYKRPIHMSIQPVLELRPWQKVVYDMMSSINDDRHIYWFLDSQGNSGKSMLCKYMEYYNENKLLLLTDVPNMRDVANVMYNALIEGNTLEYVIIDIPRSYQPNSEFYQFCEKVKDGRITATKYGGGILRFNNKCLMVFSNNKPSQINWTKDRCRLHDINEIISSPVISDLSPLSSNMSGSVQEEYYDDIEEWDCDL